METDTACHLVLSDIHHTRHAPRAHFLRRPGLSVLLDIDRMDEADNQSGLFSVGRFNLLSISPSDYGCFHKGYGAHNLSFNNLGDYIRALATRYGVEESLAKIDLLTFPRICGISFNPINVYRCFNAEQKLVMVVYEVHNTFGELHSYIGLCHDDGSCELHDCAKSFHVSPFFDVQGHYQLSVKQRENDYSLLIRYRRDQKPALTATLRGTVIPLTTTSILKSMMTQRQWPMRPWFAIHVEAAKLFFKRIPFFSKPEPPVKPDSPALARGSK